MDSMTVGQRVVSKANPTFHGVVTRVDTNGLGGYVHFDSDEEPEAETYFSAGELDLET